MLSISSSHQKVYHCLEVSELFVLQSREFGSGGVRGRVSGTGNMRVKDKSGILQSALGLPSTTLKRNWAELSLIRAIILATGQ